VDDINTARDAKEGTHTRRVGQIHLITSYMTVYLMLFLPKITYRYTLFVDDINTARDVKEGTHA